MGINLGGNASTGGGLNLGGGITAPAPTPVLDTQRVSDGKGGLTLNMEKNQILDLTKANPNLTKVTVGLGWDVGSGQSFDLDAVALCLNSNNKLTGNGDICFFNNKDTKGCHLTGDNLTGAGEGDDEQIIVDLNAVPADVQKIVFTVVIYQAESRRQNFGMVSNAYIRLMDAGQGDKELCRFILNENGSVSTTVVFAEVHRDGATWNFRTIGEGKMADINSLAQLYF